MFQKINYFPLTFNAEIQHFSFLKYADLNNFFFFVLSHVSLFTNHLEHANTQILILHL